MLRLPLATNYVREDVRSARLCESCAGHYSFLYSRQALLPSYRAVIHFAGLQLFSNPVSTERLYDVEFHVNITTGVASEGRKRCWPLYDILLELVTKPILEPRSPEHKSRMLNRSSKTHCPSTPFSAIKSSQATSGLTVKLKTNVSETDSAFIDPNDGDRGSLRNANFDYTMTRLIAREDFIAFIRCEIFKSYIPFSIILPSLPPAEKILCAFLVALQTSS